MTAPTPDPAAVLTPEALTTARARAAQAPPLTPVQRDLLTAVFRPVVTSLHRPETPA
ncbi:hypothetical protein [Actinokineospora inagensis]|uniref:hypothetical protein n=1 Tax=Actinokineospora inagensis TaxID=103730 RepID=UPI00041E3547|nr:hypothetical protein [Actinokineospora inagensis]